jgi:hypothetical protein
VTLTLQGGDRLCIGISVLNGVLLLAAQVARKWSMPTRDDPPVLRFSSARGTRPLYALLLLLGVVSLLISETLGSHTLEPILLQKETYADISKELGYAFIIAFAIAVMVETSAQRERSQQLIDYGHQVNRNALRHAFGILYPNEVVSEVFSALSSKFYKTEFRIEISVSVEEGLGQSSSPSVRLRTRHMMQVRNISPFTESLDFFGEIDPDDESVLALFVDGQPYSTKDPIKFSYPMHANQEREVVIMTDRRVEPVGNEFFATNSLCKIMVLSAKTSSDIERFGATAIHRNPLRSVGSVASVGEYEWRTEGLVLPLQGILVWWACKQPGLQNS